MASSCPIDLVADALIREACDNVPEAWRVIDLGPDDPARKLKIDEDLHRDALEGRVKHPLLRVWTNRQCLVATRRQQRSPGFEAAAARFEQLGWPVLVRASGGGTVAHAEGTLNVTLIHFAPEIAPASGYRPLTQLLIGACRRLGFAATVGPCPGSFCDGAHNLLVRGRKVAGAAAVLKQRDRTYWLTHASLTVDCDLPSLVRNVTEFERALGHPAAYVLDTHANLAPWPTTATGRIV